MSAGETASYFSAAAPDRATELASLAGVCPLSALDQARLARLRARILFARSRSDEAEPLLLDAAAQFAPHCRVRGPGRIVVTAQMPVQSRDALLDLLPRGKTTWFEMRISDR